ncbi:hypothetical protein ACX80I_15195 [Arthrobacter sp. MDT3-44]
MLSSVLPAPAANPPAPADDGTPPADAPCTPRCEYCSGPETD